jgi:hypothetical protein
MLGRACVSRALSVGHPEAGIRRIVLGDNAGSAAGPQTSWLVKLLNSRSKRYIELASAHAWWAGRRTDDGVVGGPVPRGKVLKK